jgi:2-phospho-L-lactate/phosphoenolpyruvate guanylyltransferase
VTSRTPLGGTWAVVPVKRFEQAKQRLSGVIDSAGRAALAAAMLGDVLEQLSGTAGLTGVLVVTSDTEATAIAGSFGAAVLMDATDSGVNDAVARGVSKLGPLGASAAIIAPSDIPFVTSAELGVVLAALERTAVVLAPATRDGGTNILGLSPPDVIAPAFGPDSFARHCALARDLQPAVLPLEGAGRDIDVPADLALGPVSANSRSGARTIACLRRLGRTTSFAPPRFLEETPP